MLQKFCFLHLFCRTKNFRLKFVATIGEKKFLRDIFSQDKTDVLSGLLGQTRELSFPFQQKETTNFSIDTLDLPPISSKLHNAVVDRITTQHTSHLQLRKAF